MSKLKRGKFESIVTHQSMKLNGVEFSPNECDKLTELLGSAGKMSKLPVLPPRIRNGPFTISFDGGANLTLQAGDAHVPFRFEDIDEIIQLAQDSVAKQLDLVRLNPQPRGDGYNPSRHGEVFDGRD